MGSRGRRYRRRAPRCTRRPTSSCGGTGRLIRFIPRGPIAVQGAQGARAQRTGAPVLLLRRAPHLPLEGRVCRVPRGTGRRVRRAVPARDVPAAPPGRTSARYTAARPASSRSTCSACSTAGVLPGVPARAGAAGGAKGAYRGGGLPAPASPVPPGTGERSPRRSSRRLPLSPGDPRYAIPTGARPRTGRSDAPAAPAGDVPGAPAAVLGDRSPGYTTPPAIGILLPAATRGPPGTSS
jgi:hypothetical protein